MSRKRRIVETPEEEQQYEEHEEVEEPEEDQDYNEELISQSENNEQLQKITNNLVRAVMAREYNKQLITRDFLNSAIKETSNLKNFRFEAVFAQLQQKLQQIYGMELVGVATKEKTKEAKKRNGATTSATSAKESHKQFILVNILKTQFKQILGDHWIRNADSTVERNNNDYEFEDERKFINKYEKGASFTNSELMNNGLIVMILSIIVVSGNTVTESELYHQLRKFGLGETTKLMNSFTVKDFLKNLDRLEYIEVKKDENSEIRLGRRSKNEFKPLAIYEFIKEIYGSQFDGSVRNKAVVSLTRAFGDFKNEEDEEEIATRETSVEVV